MTLSVMEAWAGEAGRMQDKLCQWSRLCWKAWAASPEGDLWEMV